MRLNATLSEDLARKLEALERATWQSTSNVVRTALERYFNEVCGAGRSSREAILGSGLIGCGEAEPDLSTTYKRHLTPLATSEETIAEFRRLSDAGGGNSRGWKLDRDETHVRQ